MSEKSTPQVLSLIKQYLEYHSFTRTLESLKLDVSSVGYHFGELPGRQSSAALRHDLNQNELMVLFTEGDPQAFFKLWKKSIPKEQQLCDKGCITLLFELNLYFLVYPLRGNPNMAVFQQRHSHFVRYLEETASQNEIVVNSSLARFLCLGLASIANQPLDNFMVKELLQPGWSKHIKEKLGLFLNQVLPSTSTPELSNLYEKATISAGISTDKKVKQLESKCIQYKSLYVQQQREYYNVLAVATELVESLENAILGKGVDPSTIERVCGQLFEQNTAAALHMDFTRPGTAANILRQSMVKQEHRIQEVEGEGEAATIAVLDIQKIKQSLVQGYSENSYLLQAIRWRFIKSSTDVERQELLTQCINNDLLGVHDAAYSNQVLQTMLSDTSDLVLQENFARLLHVLSALSAGCVYIASHTALVSALIDSLTSSTRDDMVRQVVLGALQTLSLKRSIQTQMLESDMMEWLLNILNDPDELSDYTLHHASALLMNLCLRTKGRMYVSEKCTKLLSVVEGLLEHESALVREYINGILFSALNMANIREKANEMGFAESLKLLIGISPEETAHQLQYCLDQLVSPGVEEDPAEGDSEDEEEEEVIEDNLDSLTMDSQLPESLQPTPGQAVGEELLCSKYLTDIKLKLPAGPVDMLVIEHQNQAPRDAGNHGNHGNQAPRDAGYTGTQQLPADHRNRGTPPQSGNHGNHGTPPHSGNASALPRSGNTTAPKSGAALISANDEEKEYITNPDDRPLKGANVDFSRVRG